MRVLSLFDGASCGRVALARAGVNITEYHAFEIDKHAVAVSKSNWPDIIHHGSVVGANFKSLGKFDMLIGGSPCQGFSRLGKQLGFEDERSKLFYEFIRAGNEVKPDYFLLENIKLKREEIEHVNYYVGGVTPTMINSVDVSAQNRRRLYWTNLRRTVIASPMTFVDVWMPSDKTNSDGWHNWWHQKGDYQIKRGLSKILREKDDIALCLLARHVACWAGNLVPVYDRFRFITPQEAEILQTLPIDYTACVPDRHRYRMLGNGWTVDVIKQFFMSLRVK